MRIVDLYVFRVDLRDRPDRHFVACLSPAERTRAAAFATAQLSRFAIVSQGLLRHVVSRHAGIAPADIVFGRTAYGKPSVQTRAGGPSPIAFNLSHSGDFVAIAVGRGGTVGIDIECPRSIAEIDALLDRFFTDGERAAVRDRPAPHRMEAFLRLWTRKEAVLKAAGVGLSVDPVRIDARGDTVFPDDAGLPPPGASAGAWFLQDLSRVGLFYGAVATDVADTALCVRAECEDPAALLS